MHRASKVSAQCVCIKLMSSRDFHQFIETINRKLSVEAMDPYFLERTRRQAMLARAPARAVGRVNTPRAQNFHT